jgi:beta-N-acetylhexosaminidase
MKLTTLTLILVLCASSLFAKRNDSLDIKIGQMIMIGINDHTSLSPGDPMIEELSEGKLGGVVLFEKNIAKTNSADSLKMLISSLQKTARLPLFISIDEEGGKVHRLKEKYGFVAMPSAAYLGKLDNADSTLFYNRRLAQEVADLGINLNYAPTMDMAMNPDNPVIVKPGRSFGAQPDLVARQAALCIKAQHEYGVKTILKHFPGHGSSLGDSHLGIADVTNTWDFSELYPYHTLLKANSYDAIMTAHIINQRWDPDMLPATLSDKVVTGMLRGLLGYNGVVFSDDMQMQAISDNYGFEHAIALAINAGVDVLMFANTNVAVEDRVSASDIHATIRKLVRRHKISRDRIDEAYTRIQALKHKVVS